MELSSSDGSYLKADPAVFVTTLKMAGQLCLEQSNRCNLLLSPLGFIVVVMDTVELVELTGARGDHRGARDFKSEG